MITWIMRVVEQQRQGRRCPSKILHAPSLLPRHRPGSNLLYLRSVVAILVSWRQRQCAVHVRVRAPSLSPSRERENGWCLWFRTMILPLDRRPTSHGYQNYVDGRGIQFGAERSERYCPTCRPWSRKAVMPSSGDLVRRTNIMDTSRNWEGILSFH